MKKLSLFGAVLAVVLVPLAFGNTSYAADSTCPVGFTGPDSVNICTSKTEFTCKVTNNNEVTVDNTNQQIAVSGSAGSNDNGNGGSAMTGSATNANGTTFAATVTNGTACTVVATTAPITPVVTPPVGQPVAPQGSGAAAGAGAVKPTALANTATLSPAMIIAGLIGVLGASVLGARLAVTAYGHFKA